MEGATLLCQKCASQEFLSQKAWEDQDRGVDISLGTLDELRSRPDCPFCRLQLSAMTEGIRVFTHTEASWLSIQRGYMIGPLGTRVVFVDEESSLPWLPKAGRVIEKTHIDIGLVQKWLNLCKSLHADQCAPLPLIYGNSSNASIKAFRVIDVIQHCIVDAPDNFEYLALSYVWGDTVQLRLSTKNRALLMTPGGLKQVSHHLLDTIKDAILMVSLIGKRYLWIDTLCLLQDDEIDLKNGIRSMDLIYGGAIATIIAASGANANAGLPGLRTGSRRIDQGIEEIAPGVKMMILRHLDGYLKLSKYSSRGWTFQEQILSRRNIVFVNERVYFSCRRCFWCEDNNDDDFPQRDNQVEDLQGSLIPLALDPDENVVAAYQTLLLYFSERELSKPSDAINAFEGILSFLSGRMNSRIVEGLPVTCFDVSILFFGVNLQRRHGFPSYSWSGWTGHVQYPSHWECHWPEEDDIVKHSTHVNTWLDTRTWILWYERSKEGNVLPLFESMTPTEVFPEHKILARFRRDFHEGAGLVINKLRKMRVGREWGRTQKTKEEHEDNTESNKQSPSTVGYQNRCHPFLISNMPRIPKTAANFACTYRLLQFWTYTIHLVILPASQPDSTVFEIADRRGRICGHVIPDNIELIQQGIPIEIMLLSESGHPLVSQTFHRPWESDDKEMYKFNPDDWSFYWALMISWNNGIAERRGICIIHKKAMDWSHAPGPSWKEIILG